MNNSFKIIKTNELNKSDLISLAKLFMDSFHKKVSYKSLLKKYLNNFKGYSYHGLYFNENQSLVGAYTFIPKKFIYNKKTITGLHLQDTCFPYEGSVNPFSIKKGVFEVINFANKDLNNLFFLYGFPNKKIESLWIKLLKWNYVDTLSSCLDLFPLITIFSKSQSKALDEKSVIISSIENKEIQSRLNTFKSFFLKLRDNSFLAMWQINKLIPLQVLDDLNIYNNNLKKIRNIPFLFRLLVPSISSYRNSVKKKLWQFSFQMPKFPIYVLPLRDEFKNKSIEYYVSFIWNDVP